MLLTPVAAQDDTLFELPSGRPSVANGAAIYAEYCVACHGASGRGDGTSAQQVQETFGNLPADLTADITARASTGAEWYTTISNGQLDQGMPPFNAALTVDQRWDVIAYVWNLGSSASGEAIYVERCTQCHGESGRGDGEQATGTPPDFSDLNTYRNVASGQWANALNNAHVPSFSGKLSAGERNAVIDYVRSFAYDATSAELPDESVSSSQLTVSGTLVNLTPGADVPHDLEVTVFHFPGGLSDNVTEQTVMADASGQFRTSEFVDAQVGDVFAATVLYGSVTYPSQFITLEQETQSVDLGIGIYEETSSVDTIQIDAFHIVLTLNATGISVDEIYVISNNGDRIVVNREAAALNFMLPAGASEFQLLDGGTPATIGPTPDGFGYFEALPPGETTLQFAIRYQLSSEATLDRSFEYPVSTINVLFQSDDISLSSAQLIDQGILPFEQQSYQQFSGGPLAVGQILAIRLGAQTVDTNLLIGIALSLLILFAVAGIIIWRRRVSTREHVSKPSSAERERLLNNIAALDDSFEAGELEEAVYRKQRDEMKQKLLRMMRERET